MPGHTGFCRASALLRHVMRLEPWRSELRMASANGLAGTADMIFKQAGKPTSEGVVIVDWKRTAEAPQDSKYDHCRKELSHLPAGKFWKYATQLNLYAHLLWDTCRVPTVQMLLVLLHPNGSQYDVLLVPEMPEVAAIYRFPDA